MNALKATTKLLHAQLTDAEALIRRSGNLMRGRQRQVWKLEVGRTNLEAERDAAEENVTALYQDAQVTLSANDEQIDELDKEVDKLNVKVGELNGKVAKLKIELDSTYSTLMSEADAVKRTLQLELTSEREEQDRLHTTLDTRDSQIADLNRKCDDLTQSVCYKDRTMTSFSQQILTRQENFETLVSQHAQKVQDLEAQIDPRSQWEHERLEHMLRVQDIEALVKDDEIAKLLDQFRRLRID
jgi:chromosome segregation ATPase